jgi:hypothetical protein
MLEPEVAPAAGGAFRDALLANVNERMATRPSVTVSGTVAPAGDYSHEEYSVVLVLVVGAGVVAPVDQPRGALAMLIANAVNIAASVATGYVELHRISGGG